MDTRGCNVRRGKLAVVAACVGLAGFVVAGSAAAEDPADTQPAPSDESANGSTSTEALDLHRVEVATVGFDMITQSPIVLLRDPETGNVVPIWVGLAEARAIAWALNGYVAPRPMTHDLMVALLKEMKAELVDVIVDELRDNTFHGKLKLRIEGEKELRTVDTRPSDDLALALRTGATIHVAAQIFKDTPKYDFLPPNESRQVVHALGVTVVTPTDEHRRIYHLPDRSGVVVTQVSGVAEKRGPRPGDLSVQVNERTPTSPMEFFDALRLARPGKAIRIAYLRDGKERRVELPAVPPTVDPAKIKPAPGTIKV